ncbi:unnamed protein product [Mytilus coruscus]|uniref:Reverse transcriptase domain-containing protein n=1 Tax=Mytilus coruscus TaxID=42192 RepID=A0A6J8A246_MYTCO|nr:unnamed protein product [Mytilus coruscus]
MLVGEKLIVKSSGDKAEVITTEGAKENEELSVCSGDGYESSVEILDINSDGDVKNVGKFISAKQARKLKKKEKKLERRSRMKPTPNLDAKENRRDYFRLEKQINTLCEKAANGNDIDIAKLESLRLELSQYELEKCRGAVLRSKAVWAVESDKNTKYFLNLEKYKQENNSVKELLNVNNESVNDINGILGLQYDFYKELYTCVDTDDIKMNELLDCVDVKIDENGHQLCESDISFDEIIKALSQMSKNKSPGSDGLTVEFYCHFYSELTMYL